MRRLKRTSGLWLLLLPLGLSACGDFPEPMLHRPGRMGMILSHPPPQRLVVPVPGRALLADQAASAFAHDLANAMVAQTVPAFAQPPQKGDWVLRVGATLAGGHVTPSYTIIDPRGHVQGNLPGTPVASKAWADGDPAALGAEADAAGPPLAALLSNIDAALKESDPNSLYNRPPRLDFSGITGAPGDGDQSLAREMRRDIAGLGVILVDQRNQADYLMHARVRLASMSPTVQRIEIDWIVETGDGREAGRVAQLHAIPRGSLDSYWGDVAVAAATEAAKGVKEVIDNNIGKKTPGGAAGTS